MECSIFFAFVSYGQCNELHWYTPRVLLASNTKRPTTHTPRSSMTHTPANVHNPSCATCSWILPLPVGSGTRQRATLLWINKDTCSLIWRVLPQTKPWSNQHTPETQKKSQNHAGRKNKPMHTYRNRLV